MAITDKMAIMAIWAFTAIAVIKAITTITVIRAIRVDTANSAARKNGAIKAISPRNQYVHNNQCAHSIIAIKVIWSLRPIYHNWPWGQTN